MKKFIGIALFTGLALGVNVNVFAQDGNTQNIAPKAQENTFRKDKMRRRGMRDGGGNVLSRLNLTDAQKQQLETIRRSNQPNESARAEMRELMQSQRRGVALTDAQRARLDALREQNKTTAEKMRQQIFAVLTPEQRTQFEQMRRGGRAEGMGGGQGFGMREGKRGGMMRGGLENLNLTDAQKEQLRNLRAADRSRSTGNKTDATRQELRGLMQAKRGGGTLTAEQEARLKTLREQMRAENEKRHQQILAILTPQQREQLEKNKAERRERMKDRRQNPAPTN